MRGSWPRTTWNRSTGILRAWQPGFAFQADADFNQKIVAGLRRREPAVDFQDARTGAIIDLLGDAIDELLLLWAATEAEEWRDKVGYLPL